jgi:hypothetical protein
MADTAGNTTSFPTNGGGFAQPKLRATIDSAAASAHEAIDKAAAAAKPAVDRAAGYAHGTVDKAASVAAPASDWIQAVGIAALLGFLIGRISL